MNRLIGRQKHTKLDGDMTTLDIVIPAYKGRYLADLLRSLCAQSSNDFGVIVCDDASPDSIQEICEPFQKQLNLRYVRFETNLGNSNLVAHWNRSVGLSTADYIWLPGDDDLIGPTCVAAFQEAVRMYGNLVDVFSFAVRMVDQGGKVICESPPARAKNAAEFLELCATYKIRPVPVGYIFSGKIFRACRGFVAFDHGWHSDTASITQFCAQNGIKAIDDAYVDWRKSEINVSHLLDANPIKSIEIYLDFIKWKSVNNDMLGISNADIKKLAENDFWNIYRELSRASFFIWFKALFQLSSIFAAFGNKSAVRHIYRFVRARGRFLSQAERLLASVFAATSRSSNGSTPMLSIRDRAFAPPLQEPGTWRWRSLNAGTSPNASLFYPNDGSSREPSPGSADADVSRATSSVTPKL
jgi:glycosyltransferase involved in cell wall biosynthesis